MFPEQDQTVFDWIRRGRDKFVPRGNLDWEGTLVSHLIPPVFESYAKLLHKIQAHYKLIDKPLSATENAILGVPTCEPLRSFVESRGTGSRDNRIRWKELADLLDVPFAPEIHHGWYRQRLQDPWCWPRLLSGPNDGHLSEEECHALASRLKPVADGNDCFFRFSDIPFYAPVYSGKPQMFRGALDEVCDFQREKRLSFEYWWPSNRSWCVCSDYDLAFTIIGGGRNLISTILLDGLLECIEVTPQTRIDVFAAMP
jgi:hypothetical protein